MAGSVETVTAEELPGWVDKWFDVRLYTADFAPAFRRIKILLAASTKENFAGSRSPDGISWLPLKRARTRNKRKGDRGRPLRDTGMLMGSVTANGPGHEESQTKTRLEWGTNLDYAEYHQHGTRFIPARPFVGFNDTLTEEIGEVLAEFAEEELTR